MSFRLEAFGFSRRVTANIGIKAVSEVLVKAGRFVLILVAARVLAPEGFGLYMFAFAFGNILANASDFGLQMYLSREVARGPEHRASVLHTVVRAKIGLTTLVVVLLAAVALAYPRSLDVRLLLLLAGCTALLQSWVELWNYYFRGIQSLREEAWLNLFHMVVGVGSGVFFLERGGGPEALFWCLLAAAGLANLAAVVRLARRVDLRPSARSDGWRAPAARALTQSAPIGVAILLSILYFRIDVVFLERMRSDSEVGAYSAAYKLLESFMFIPAVFLAALYPAFTEMTERSLDELRRIYRNSVRWMAGLSVAIASVLIVIAPGALALLYGQAYDETVQVLRILAPALVFIFINYALTHFLIALGGQKWNAVFAGICLGFNAVANALVIPRFGAPGAAATTLLTELTLFLLCFLTLRRLLARHAARWHAGTVSAPGETA